MSAASRRGERCFVERDASLSLARRAGAEGLGTLLLVLAAAAGTAAAARLPAPAQPLIAAVAISGALVGLILALGRVSGGHFNPLISSLQWLAGERTGRCALAYVAAQLGGGVLGALVARVLSGVASPSAASSPTLVLILSELAASLGLMTVVLGCSRAGLREAGPLAVGAWLAAAILATPSGSYANPAITVAAMLAVGPLALTPTTAALYGAAQVAGGLLALAAAGFIAPRQGDPNSHADKDSCL